jgi:hypothetical protein
MTAWMTPTFQLLKMDAEIGAYNEDLAAVTRHPISSPRHLQFQQLKLDAEVGSYHVETDCPPPSARCAHVVRQHDRTPIDFAVAAPSHDRRAAR